MEIFFRFVITKNLVTGYLSRIQQKKMESRHTTALLIQGLILRGD